MTNRDETEKSLLDSHKPEAKIFKEEVEKIRAYGACVAQLDLPNENITNITMNTETSDFRLFPLTFLINDLTLNVNPINAITIAIPTLVAMDMTITNNLLVEPVRYSPWIPVSTSARLGVIAMCFIPVGGIFILGIVLGTLLAAAIGYGIYLSLLTVIDKEYLKMLE